MTAPDTRPPSDETRATGWHRHGLTGGSGCIWPDGRCYVCDAFDLFDPPPENPPATPVLVVDPAEAREKIARWLMRRYGTAQRWERVDPAVRQHFLAHADGLIAALATQEPTT